MQCRRSNEVQRLSRSAVCLLPAADARADELLVMPYACTMVGGRPLLTPGPEQGHRIFGQRDQRKFTACSPVNPGMCRNWTVHRFDLDCDGARVPWVSVVAATSEASRRAWLLDGRLLLRMGPAWSLAPDDPCAREPGLDDRSTGRMRRYCADRLAMAPPPVVEMPFGFAPMLGIDGIFVKAAPGSARPAAACVAARSSRRQPATPEAARRRRRRSASSRRRAPSRRTWPRPPPRRRRPPAARPPALKPPPSRCAATARPRRRCRRRSPLRPDA